MLMTITIIFKICGGVHTCFFYNFAPQYFILLQFYNCITFYFMFLRFHRCAIIIPNSAKQILKIGAGVLETEHVLKSLSFFNNYCLYIFQDFFFFCQPSFIHWKNPIGFYKISDYIKTSIKRKYKKFKSKRETFKILETPSSSIFSWHILTCVLHAWALIDAAVNLKLPSPWRFLPP